MESKCLDVTSPEDGSKDWLHCHHPEWIGWTCYKCGVQVLELPEGEGWHRVPTVAFNILCPWRWGRHRLKDETFEEHYRRLMTMHNTALVNGIDYKDYVPIRD